MRRLLMLNHNPFAKKKGVFSLANTWLGKGGQVALQVIAWEKAGMFPLLLSFTPTAIRLVEMMYDFANECLREQARNNNQPIPHAAQSNFSQNALKLVYATSIVSTAYSIWVNPKAFMANQTINFFGDYALNSVYFRLPIGLQEHVVVNEAFALLHLIKLELGRKAYLYYIKDKQVKVHPNSKETENLEKLNELQKKYEAHRDKVLPELRQKLKNFFGLWGWDYSEEEIAIHVNNLEKFLKIKKFCERNGFDVTIATRHQAQKGLQWTWPTKMPHFDPNIGSYKKTNENQFLLIKPSIKQEYPHRNTEYLKCQLMDLIDNGEEVILARKWDKTLIAFFDKKLNSLLFNVEYLYYHLSDNFHYHFMKKDDHPFLLSRFNSSTEEHPFSSYSNINGENYFHRNYMQYATNILAEMQKLIEKKVEYTHQLAAGLLVNVNALQFLYFKWPNHMAANQDQPLPLNNEQRIIIPEQHLNIPANHNVQNNNAVGIAPELNFAAQENQGQPLLLNNDTQRVIIPNEHLNNWPNIRAINNNNITEKDAVIEINNVSQVGIANHPSALFSAHRNGTNNPLIRKVGTRTFNDFFEIALNEYQKGSDSKQQIIKQQANRPKL